MGTFQGFGDQTLEPSGVSGATTSQAWITDCSKQRKGYLIAEEDKEEDEVEQRLDELERTQEKFHQDLEEVIQAIPDMVVRALQAERAAHQAPGTILGPQCCGENLGDSAPVGGPEIPESVHAGSRGG
ncbi:UNVERIFIED_CONTAM: hypothetical protein K2H54_048231 [Gekko kuhli]